MDGPEMPVALIYLYRWFIELHEARRAGMGPEAIGYPDIASWAQLTGRRPAPWETATIRDLDRLWLTESRKKRAQGQPGG